MVLKGEGRSAGMIGVVRGRPFNFFLFGRGMGGGGFSGQQEIFSKAFCLQEFFLPYRRPAGFFFSDLQSH